MIALQLLAWLIMISLALRHGYRRAIAERAIENAVAYCLGAANRPGIDPRQGDAYVDVAQQIRHGDGRWSS